MTQGKASLTAIAMGGGIAALLQAACHTGCDLQVVPEGARFVATVVAPSAECPELVPLRAGDTLTLVAGPVSDDGVCEGNGSTGVPAEYPQYPDSPFLFSRCGTGHVSFLGFACEATAPSCPDDAVTTGGSVVAFVGGVPKGSEVLNTEFTITVAAGGKASCNCFTKIPVTVQRG